MILGGLTVNDTLCRETYLSVGIDVNLGTNGAGTWTIGGYTMPMTGTLSAKIQVLYQFSNGAQTVSGVISESTPVPPNQFGFTRGGNAFDGRMIYAYGEILALWPSLVVGQQVTLNLRVNIGIFPPTVAVISALTLLRATRQ